MFLELPESLEVIGYYQGGSLVLWITSIVLLFALAVAFFIKAFKMEDREPKIGLLAYGLFGILYGMMRVMYIIGVYSPSSYDFYITLGYIFSVSSLLPILYVLETQVITATKKAFLIITLFCFVVSLIALISELSRYVATTVLWLLQPSAAFVVIAMYLYIAIKSEGTVRRKATMILIGIFLVMASHLMDTELFISAVPLMPLEIPPILLIMGCVLISYPQLLMRVEK